MPRSHPRVSLLKLAEYMEASAVRRRSIILSQAHPPTPPIIQYRRAEAAIVSFLGRGARSVASLEATIRRLETASPTSELDARDLRNSAAALQHFIGLLPELDLSDRLIRLPRRRAAYWLAGVEVSVQPAAIIRRRGEDTAVGAVKVCFSKSRALPGEEGRYATTVMRAFLEERLAGMPLSVDPSLCQVIDVFSGRVHVAPASYKRRMAAVTAACAEIANGWPRGDFDQAVAATVA